MAISKNIMGMNARNYLYIRPYNHSSATKAADDKLLTKEILIRNKIQTPPLLVAFRNRDDVKKFSWKLPESGFVIKPARGYGGAGILPIKAWDGTRAITVSGEEYTIDQLRSHLLDILEGSYSLQFLPDGAFIENLINPDPFFKRLAPIGLSDVRVIVFNSIPIMAMIRVPTQESKGKANIHQGAVACGIDIRTGITTYGVSHNKLVDTISGTKIKTQGIKIPRWDEVLLIATKAQNVIGLGYAGVDIVLDEALGPSILEINARPGLSIQIANQESLRTRLERIEDIKITTPERGIEVAKSLFSQSEHDKSTTPNNILTVAQQVRIITEDKTQRIEAKLDTGALRTSIDRMLAKQLGLKKIERVVYVKSASGKNYREMVEVTFQLGGKRIKTTASVVDRSELQFPMIIGRRDLVGFLIKPILHEKEPDVDNNEREIVEGKKIPKTAM